jgi:cation diffusion facilitator family transporter
MTAPSPSGHTDQARIDAQLTVRRVTGLSVAVAVVLIALKAFALGASGSVSILATLADSGLDLIASLATFYAVRWAAAPPDEAHRYGHGKAEALAALVQAGLVFASALFIGWAAVNRILDPRPITAGSWSVGVMLVSMALTGWLVWMQTRAVKASGSIAVAGDRAHYAADMAANLVALIGVASGAFLNAPGLDAAAGLVVAVWLFWGAAGMLRIAAQQLLDRAAPDEDRIAVTTAVLADPRISGVHQLRTRQAGPTLMVQMHVDLEPSLTLVQAHDIVVEAERRVLAVRPGADIIIHPDPRGRAETHPAPQVSAPSPAVPARPSDPSTGPAAATPKGPWS